MDKEGVKGAKNFFEAKVSVHQQGGHYGCMCNVGILGNLGSNALLPHFRAAKYKRPGQQCLSRLQQNILYLF